ncbi:MAG: hypothetical protein JKX72_08480 [Robiginitomaculum sp.]|nr:hypothetical protein [Robiginitomaculum sp.]
MFNKIVVSCIFVAVFFMNGHASGQIMPKTPFNDGGIHEGVMTCYGSTCHSRQEATGITVRQNESLTWQDGTSTTGAHYRAYKTLLTERSKSIALRLGLFTPAHEAKECLSCHTDGIVAARRGAKFQIDDGVGCESCHGAAGDWLSRHYEVGASHKTNVSRGLYPLEDAKTRAGVCLSCHMGSEAEGQFVTHRLMAAGHPRMSFELDLFTALQSHHSEDVDYETRKNVQSGTRIWAIGQAMTLKQQLRLFQNPALNRDGIFPELVFFDCLACHREISDDPNWRPVVRQNPGRPSLPGIVKFNDASMIMLLATARQIAPDLAPSLEAQIRAFHSSISGNGSQSSATQALEATTNALIKRIERTNFTKAQTLDILDIVVTDTLTRRYTDYVAAEQAIMAVDTLLSSMIASKQVARIEVSQMRKEINMAYDAVENPNTYNQDQLTNALRNVHARLRELR